MGWWQRRSVIVRDAVGAVPIVLVFVLAQQIFGDGGPVVRAVVIVVVMGTALTVRRRWPLVTYVAALLVVALATTGIEFLVIASYTLGAYVPRARPTWVAIGSAVALVAGYLQYWPSLVLTDIAGDILLIAAVAILPPALGRAVGDARRTTSELAARNAELLELREAAAEHAAQAERFRIARELHDVVAHHVSAMTVRARAGRHVAARDPGAAADALSYIADAGTEALTAMGSFVGTLRGRGTADASGELAPQPGLHDLPALLETFRGTGLVVHTQLDDMPQVVGPALGLNAYRIVQEALTNVIRHGAAERAWVRVTTHDGRLQLQVDDNGRGLRDHERPTGHGLIGIGERVALHDGSSELGPSPRGGCRLTATLALTDGHAAAVDPADAPVVRR